VWYRGSLRRAATERAASRGVPRKRDGVAFFVTFGVRHPSSRDVFASVQSLAQAEIRTYARGAMDSSAGATRPPTEAAAPPQSQPTRDLRCRVDGDQNASRVQQDRFNFGIRTDGQCQSEGRSSPDLHQTRAPHSSLACSLVHSGIVEIGRNRRVGITNARPLYAKEPTTNPMCTRVHYNALGRPSAASTVDEIWMRSTLRTRFYPAGSDPRGLRAQAGSRGDA